ncbi:MFS transporter [Halorussus gelatinilyticus]|uniref:MFS transporter n=1 Tax=Halorussus gelatinilyticus TaxID=2937524 RepID=A0A8U0IFK7_9EURY|nr:MFS transporter [Halorussus gelatinilyticus]UPV99762.1 MFS transporter [Halorussus gelatinilyticus]
MEHRWLYAWGLGSVALGAASLLVPLYVVALGGDPVALGLLAASAALLGTPGALLWGRVADRTANRRAVVVWSLVGVAASLAAIPVVESVTAVLALNALLWFVSAAGGPVLTLLVVADAPESEWSRRIAALNTYQGYGWAGGLVLGTVWLGVLAPRFASPLSARRWLFAVCGALAAVSAVAAARWVPTVSAAAADLPKGERRRIGRLLSRSHRNAKTATFPFTPNRLYWTTRGIRPRQLLARFSPRLTAYFLAVALFSTGFAAFWAPLPAYLSTAGYGGDATFGLYLATSLASALCYGAVGKLSDRFDARLFQSGALGVRAAAFPAVAVVGTVAGVAGLTANGGVFALLGVTWAVIAVTGTGLVTRLAPATVRGEALGVHAALVAASGGIGGLLGGWTADFGYHVAFAVAGGLVALGAAVVVAIRGLSTPGDSGSGTDASAAQSSESESGTD